MEGVSTSVYKGIKGYWRRKGYARLNGVGRKRKVRAVHLGSASGDVSTSSSTRRRRFWRIKLTPRLRLKLRFSPKRFLLGLRDAYVNMMMKLANSRAVGGGYSGDGGFGLRPVKDFFIHLFTNLKPG